MTYLLLIGYGRPGRWDGFLEVAVDEKSFSLAQTIPSEWDEDDLDTPSESARLMRSLISQSGHFLNELLDLEEPEDSPWNLIPDEPPYAAVHAILIWNSNT